MTARRAGGGAGGAGPPAADAAVADVVGSILLVGITVVMAAAFALLLFAFDGPPDAVHARLAVAVGPGADLAWGSGDEVLTLAHNGGEPLEAASVRLVYAVAGGAAQAVQPAFPGGRLTVGQSWSQVLAEPVGQGEGLRLQVVVSDAEGSRLVMDATTAGGAAPGVLTTYAYAANFTAGTGTVAGFLLARSAGDGGATADLTEAASTGPVTSTLPATASAGSGASDPQNVLASDGLVAGLDGDGEWVEASGFAAPAGTATVTQVVLGVEAAGVPGSTATVTHQETRTGTDSSSSAVSAAGLSATAGSVYVAAVANGQASLRSVTGVSGLGLSWSKVAEAQAGDGRGRLEVWVGTGAPSPPTTVTATFSGQAQSSAIAVSRYTGADPSNPVQASQAGEASGSGSSAWSLASISGSAARGRLFAAVNGGDRDGVTFLNPPALGERADLDAGGRVQLGVADGVAALANAASGTLDGGAADWQAIALTLRPAATPDPVVLLSYLVGGAAGATTGSLALASTEATYTLDVTADRAWDVAAIAQAAVRANATSLNGGQAQIDRLFLTVTTTSGSTTYALAVAMGFDPVPAGAVQTVQVGYHVVSPGDAFLLQVWDGSSWATSRTCPGSLSSPSPSAFACTLVLPGEYRSGAPIVRFIDATPTGTSQGVLRLDYVRVATR